MTKKNFIDLLLNAEIKGITVISAADYEGGRQHLVLLSPVEEAQECLGEFDYIEWCGDTTDIIRSRKKIFWDVIQPPYEEEVETPHTLEELIIWRLNR